MKTKAEVTIQDLYRVPDHCKAEIIQGELVFMTPTGGEIYVSLREYEKRTAAGYALPDNVGFVVNLPHRKSFSPDAAFYTGELSGGEFLQGAPVFAVEVRSMNDYGTRAQRRIAEPAIPGWTMAVDDLFA